VVIKPFGENFFT